MKRGVWGVAMGFKFTDAGRYPYEPGGFFLGVDDYGREVGIRSDRHLITVAGARSGKGAALIVPNLKRWPGACVVVDPKGENATITAGERAAMGQSVGVVDPYRKAGGDAAALRCSVNPFDLLDPESLDLRADLETLADGLVRTFDPKHEEWAETARRMIAGAADYMMATQPRESWTLPAVRALFVLPPDDLKPLAQEMAALETETGLAQEAGGLFLTKLATGDNLDAQAFTKAGKELGWIGDPAFRAVLGDELPRFDLRTLKDGTGSLYLCIPPDKLRTRGQFLRLFVSMGLRVMASELAGHERDGGECLFLLDEFHSLGKLGEVATASGQMPGYGVHLWPFLQDLGQLEGLYGDNEMHTFFANADAHIFFGNSDAKTLNEIALGLGVVEAAEIGPAPTMGSGINPITGATVGALMGGSSREDHERMTGALIGGFVGAVGATLHSLHMHEKQAEMNEYQQKAMMVGKPRVAPDEVRELVAKHDGDKVARSMIVFAKGGDKLNIRLAPYFQPPPQPKPLPGPAPSLRQQLAAEIPSWQRLLVVRAAIVLGVMLAPMPFMNGAELLFPGIIGSGPGIALALAAYAFVIWALLKTNPGKTLRGWAGWRKVAG